GQAVDLGSVDLPESVVSDRLGAAFRDHHRVGRAVGDRGHADRPGDLRAGDGPGVLPFADRGDVGRAHAGGLQGRVGQAGDREVIGPARDLDRWRVEVLDGGSGVGGTGRTDVATTVTIGAPERVVIVQRGRPGR